MLIRLPLLLLLTCLLLLPQAGWSMGGRVAASAPCVWMADDGAACHTQPAGASQAATCCQLPAAPWPAAPCLPLQAIRPVLQAKAETVWSGFISAPPERPPQSFE
ncbi:MULTISPECIES: hypothetical protein [Chromobacterium]|uniref:hypothetical protein n=1 Tax=Chromobacterium TaxID=535 RepID=UPI0018871D8D|nr:MULTISPECIES: hypothetical protein [Chromobacterium]QOZ82909.1 hypothetical protein DXT74_07395 [Chromobacterium sp. Rain0013]WON82985.1 hypothetical protein OK026_17825 [Chromobacterium haemolyticum]